MKRRAIFTFLIVLMGQLFPQEETNFFNETSGVTNIPFYYPGNFTGGRIFYALTKITSQLLDIAVTNNSSTGPAWNNITNYYRKGSWNVNNGNGSFGNLNGYYIDETYGTGQDINKIYGCVTVRLRDYDYREDFVVGRVMDQTHQGIWVTWNDGSISGVQQTLDGFTDVSQIEKGRFFNFHAREDVIVRAGNTIKVFNNQGNGYLNPTPYVFPAPLQTTFGKFKIKEMNLQALEEGYWWEQTNDNREDLITIDNFTNPPKLKVFLNSNTNTFNNSTPSWVIDLDYNISFLEVADMDHDGYNDVIVSSNSAGTKIYKNMNGQGLFTTPMWSGNFFFSDQTPITADINKDGWNDLVMVGYERVTKLYLNTKSTPIFNQTPDETHGAGSGNWYGHRVNITQAALADIYNTGGIALICSDWMSHTDPIMVENSLKVLNATNYNPAPAALVVGQDFFLDGSLWRPVVLISNKRDKDWYKWAVYKLSPNTNNQVVFLAFTEQTYFIDYSEYVIIGGDQTPVPNAYYFVKQVDLSMQYSGPSNNVYFTVGTPVCGTCGDNTNPIYKVAAPEEYKISNFPNPFNPVTKISYTIPKEGKVRISVYNTLGQNIKEIVNSIKKQGAYIQEFDGSNLPSGIYFYVLEAGNKKITKRMALLK